MRSIFVKASVVVGFAAQLVVAQNYNVPPCFLDCANRAARALNCDGIDDHACYCNNQQFVTIQAQCSVQQCWNEANNPSLVQQSFDELTRTCQVLGNNFNLRLPTALESGLANGAAPGNIGVGVGGQGIGGIGGINGIGGVGGVGIGGIGAPGGIGGLGGYRWNSSPPSLLKNVPKLLAIVAVIGATFVFLL